MTLDEAIEAVRYRCEQRLCHLGKVHIGTRDCDTEVGVALVLHEKHGVYRHAVGGNIWDSPIIEDPILFADTCCDRLIEFFSEAGRIAPEATTSPAEPEPPASATLA